MRKLIYILCVVAIMAASHVNAQEQTGKFKVTGRVLDSNNKAISYATVVLLKLDSTQVAGGATNAIGEFSLQAPKGNYNLHVQFIGYAPYKEDVNINSSKTIKDVVLKQESTVIQEVVVKAELVRREADRFVVDVASSPNAIGKNAEEMLAIAPGVWITDNQISINGQSGTRVMVNERLLNMSTEDLIVYLRSIKAEDIQKIEVIPSAGAEYEANSQGGIIKIILKKQREDGIEGSISIAASASKNDNYRVNPSINLNYRRKNLSLYTNSYYYTGQNTESMTEKFIYTNSSNHSESSSDLAFKTNNSYGVTLGSVYDISSKQSVGAEVSIRSNPSVQDTRGDVIFSTPPTTTWSNSKFKQVKESQNISATVNYMLKLDSLGSQFKLIGDMYLGNTNNNGNFIDRISPDNTTWKDSTYRNDINSEYDIMSLTANFDFKLSPTSTLKTGGKFNYNTVNDETLYERLDNTSGQWIENPLQSGVNDYSEKITALYGIYSTRLFKIMSVSAGLRAEHTYTTPKAAMGSGSTDLNIAKQNYVSLFPNLNISVPLNKKMSTMMIFAYGRKISRPGFWALNPFIVPISKYTYVTGNPFLKPTYSNDVSLTTVVKHKYTLTLGANIIENGISQIGYIDPLDPQKFIYQHVNIEKQYNYYTSLNLPLTLTKWMTLNTNVTGMNMSNDYGGKTRRKTSVFANATATATLPREFYIDLGGYYQSSMISGNMDLGDYYSINAGIKKRFLKNKWTVSVNLRNIISNNLDIKTTGPEFERYVTPIRNLRSYGISVRYSFKSGISFRAKKVESNNSDDNARLGGGN